jgi:hypothetical protein
MVPVYTALLSSSRATCWYDADTGDAALVVLHDDPTLHRIDSVSVGRSKRQPTSHQEWNCMPSLTQVVEGRDAVQRWLSERGMV